MGVILFITVLGMKDRGSVWDCPCLLQNPASFQAPTSPQSQQPPEVE
jgi:hypothetical protein